MDAMEAFLTRRSVRSYTSAPIPETLLAQLLRAAMNAPSAGNEQPWQFVVIRDRAVLEANDRYGRTLAIVVIDDKNVNLEMVKAGLAEVYRGEHASGFDPIPYLEAEKRARAEKKGMWI